MSEGERSVGAGETAAITFSFERVQSSLFPMSYKVKLSRDRFQQSTSYALIRETGLTPCSADGETGLGDRMQFRGTQTRDTRWRLDSNSEHVPRAYGRRQLPDRQRSGLRLRPRQKAILRSSGTRTKECIGHIYSIARFTGRHRSVFIAYKPELQ